MAGDFTPTPRREVPVDVLYRPGRPTMAGRPPFIGPPRVPDVWVPERELPWPRRGKPQHGEVVAFGTPPFPAEEFERTYPTPSFSNWGSWPLGLLYPWWFR